MPAKTKTKTSITPLGDRLLVLPEEREDVTSSGLVLPDTAKEKPMEGKVIAVGPGRLLDTGERQDMEVEKGQTVLFAKYAGTEVKYDDEYLIISEKDVLAIIG
jgi:chaperonin GroES